MIDRMAFRFAVFTTCTEEKLLQSVGWIIPKLNEFIVNYLTIEKRPKILLLNENSDNILYQL
jgi:hypothetical protein